MERTKIYRPGRLEQRFRKKGSHKSGKSGLPEFRLPRVSLQRALRAVLLACAILAAVVAADGWANAGEIYRGVEVAGTSVGGKTPEEARGVVQQRLAEDVPAEIRLTGAGEDVVLNSQDLGIAFDLDSTLQRAYDVGRTGGIGERLSQRLRSSFGGVGVGVDVNYDTEVVRGAVEGLAQSVNWEPVDAALLLSGTTAEAQEGTEGYRLDLERTMQNVDRAISGLKGEATVAGAAVEPGISTGDAERAADKVNRALEQPLTFKHGDREWTLEPEQVAPLLTATGDGSDLALGVDAGQLAALVPEMYSKVETEPKDAGFVFVNGAVEVEEARPGQQLDEERLVGDLNEKLFEGQHTFQVPVVESGQPELTTERAESLKPTKLLGKFKTNYAMVDDPDGARTYNLDIAAKAINQTVLAPGEVFSVNDTVSQLDYREAKVFQEGLIQYAEGGGLCQVSSTLYVAAVRSGLEIVERNAHYALLEYIKPGFDSTVWFGDYYGNGELDSRFKNTTDAYVLLREWVDEDGNMYAEVWGQPNGRTVELRSEEVDHTNSSSTWVTYKTVKENGKVVDEGVAYKDTYRSLGVNENNEDPLGVEFDPAWEWE
ncbi:MAG: peptidoglycan binding domain-containing protein [Actinomycetota bacterium]|nr:peptidoglycan binding domain-containing protein [Actinomycetota bacterium]